MFPCRAGPFLSVSSVALVPAVSNGYVAAQGGNSQYAPVGDTNDDLGGPGGSEFPMHGSQNQLPERMGNLKPETIVPLY